MKTAISLPDPLFEATERLSKRMKIPRSQIFARAVEEYLRRRRSLGVKEALDAIYATESSKVDRQLEAMQAAALEPEEW